MTNIIKDKNYENSLNSTTQIECEQYYKWSEYLTNLEYDRLANKHINIGSFPFYKETEHTQMSKVSECATTSNPHPKAGEREQEIIKVPLLLWGRDLG